MNFMQPWDLRSNIFSGYFNQIQHSKGQCIRTVRSFQNHTHTRYKKQDIRVTPYIPHILLSL
ncbi:hypothetical protein TcasGA2_TC031686 [Tribolium castaneum]|uniref:Uncharacterized protein n=1 Tax=Tribolium castaneum TaxID=7070 RepID=A0A139W8P3_TRICA|nr:hypothetical protein TcasGA2_TC031686 [Tribolium castaneum]